jgi:AAA domain
MKRRPQPGQQDLFGDNAPDGALLVAATALPGAAPSVLARRVIVDSPGALPAHTVDPDDPAQALADGWAQQAQRWALGQGADGTTARHAAQAARALSLATTEGHVCLSLGALRSSVPEGPADWRRSLLASGIVGTPAAPGACPLLLDDEDRLYLQRDFQLERRLATRIARALAAAPQALPAGVSPAARDGAIDAAAVAAAMALRGRLTIVSGGPGTGKTTAVVRLLGLLLAEQPGIRIALAAPTGKAAARMAEAIRQRAADLPPALRALLPTGASTLHRLLGVSPATRGGPGEGFAHHAGRPLPIDVLVIDEASMLDLALATRVFEAVPPEARIVLLGDQDQLAAVESGAVFAELSADPGLSPECLAELAEACATRWSGSAATTVLRRTRALADSPVRSMPAMRPARWPGWAINRPRPRPAGRCTGCPTPANSWRAPPRPGWSSPTPPTSTRCAPTCRARPTWPRCCAASTTTGCCARCAPARAASMPGTCTSAAGRAPSSARRSTPHRARPGSPAGR